MPKTQQSNSQIAKAKSSRPYKSRSQRPCDFCRRRKTCCIIEGTIPCTPCIQFNQGKCTFQEGPMKRNNKNDAKNSRTTLALDKPSVEPIKQSATKYQSYEHLKEKNQLHTQSQSNKQIQAQLLKSPDILTTSDSYALGDKLKPRQSIATKKVPILKSEAKTSTTLGSTRYPKINQQEPSYIEDETVSLATFSENFRIPEFAGVNATDAYAPQTTNTNRNRMRHSCSSLILDMKGTDYMDFIKPDDNNLYIKTEGNQEIAADNIAMFLAENSDIDSNYAGVSEVHIPVDFIDQNSFKSSKDSSHTPTLDLDFLSISSIANVSPLEDNVSTFGVNYHAPQFSGMNDIKLIDKANDDLDFMNKPNESGGVEEQWNLYLPSETDIFTLMSL